jgi:hypothetical protein
MRQLGGQFNADHQSPAAHLFYLFKLREFSNQVAAYFRGILDQVILGDIMMPPTGNPLPIPLAMV